MLVEKELAKETQAKTS